MQPASPPPVETALAASGRGQLVWDLPVRLSHWGLVLAVAGSFATHYAGPAAFEWHVRAGYATLTLAAFRVAWGFVGTRHARFVEFLRGPRAVFARAGAREVHTPLGGWMAVLLLTLLLAQAATGLFSNDEVLDSGPLAGWTRLATSNRLSDWHGLIANVLLAALALHVGAALFYRLRRRDDRMVPLLTGYRRDLAPGAAIGSHELRRALVVLCVLVALLCTILWNAPPPLDLAP